MISKTKNAAHRLLLASIMGAFSASALADYNFNFDGVASGTSANNLAVNPYSNISFLTGYETADLRADLSEILDMNNNTVLGFTHWEAYADSNVLVKNTLLANAGVAPSGTNALDASGGPVFIKFNTAQDLTSFSMQLNNSTFGFQGAYLIFLDNAYKQISTLAYDQSGYGTVITSGAMSNVGGIVLFQGNKFYDNINIATVAAVPEADTSAMLLAGLGLMGFVARRRKSY